MDKCGWVATSLPGQQPDNSPLLSKNTWKFIISSMTVVPCEIKLENKLDVIRHAPQEKTGRSTHSMNDVIAFYTFNTRFE